MAVANVNNNINIHTCRHPVVSLTTVLFWLGLWKACQKQNKQTKSFKMFRRGKLSFLSTKDDRIKIINERINLTERHLMEMCSAFSLLTRKMAK